MSWECHLWDYVVGVIVGGIYGMTWEVCLVGGEGVG